jgi:hypothetical protein
MVCNTFRTVCGVYASMRSNGEIEDDKPVPVANFGKGIGPRRRAHL